MRRVESVLELAGGAEVDGGGGLLAEREHGASRVVAGAGAITPQSDRVLILDDDQIVRRLVHGVGVAVRWVVDKVRICRYVSGIDSYEHQIREITIICICTSQADYDQEHQGEHGEHHGDEDAEEPSCFAGHCAFCWISTYGNGN